MRVSHVVPVVAALFTALVGGCFSPSYRDCEVSCDTSNLCPSGLSCISGMCRVGGMTGACGTGSGDGGGSGSGSGDSLPIEMLSSAQVGALCDYMVRCGVFEDTTVCRELIFPPSYHAFDNAIAAVGAGKAVYHGDKAKQCVDAYAQLACDRSLLFGGHFAEPSCFEIFSGTLDANATCGTNEECISGVCSVGNCPQGACCQGTCMGSTPAGVKAIGDRCSPRDLCTNGYCDQFTTTCTAYKAPGAGCGNSNECGLGYTCSLNPPQVCQKLSATGGTCQNAFDCLQLADSCSQSSGQGTCRTGGLVGDPCAGGCQLDHFCEANGVCALPPKIGESCPNYPQCLDGYCSNPGQPNAICVARLADGAQCNPQLGGNDCQGGICDQMTLTCKSPMTCF